MGEEVKRSPTLIVDAVWRRTRTRRHKTQGLGRQSLVICLDTKSKERPADGPRCLRAYNDENLKASFTVTTCALGCHSDPQLTGTSVTLTQSGTMSTVFLHLPLFGISHHTPDSPGDSPCRFSVFQLLTVVNCVKFYRHELRRDANHPAILSPTLLSGELQMEQRHLVPTRPSLHPIRAGLMHAKRLFHGIFIKLLFTCCIS